MANSALPACRALTWNLERKRPSSPTGSAAVARIAACEPDIAVITEIRLGHLDALGGFEIAPESAPPGRFDNDERKVMIWSRSPWRDIDQVGHPDMPSGRFVAGTTATPIGDIRVIGVCIPWHMSDVRSGTKDRKPWEQHRRWLELLEPLLAGSASLPVIIAGDFNQRVPRSPRGNRAMADLLAGVLDGFTTVTAGIVAGCERQGIDHIAINSRLEALSVRGWPSDDGGVRMSDHDGAFADVRLS
jgi:endonuclease/exonuclease/phosphatase family metal-dependent hydrolase